MLGALQAFVGAHNAHVVPHKAAQLIPVVRDHNIFIGAANPGFIPAWNKVWLGYLLNQLIDGAGCGLGIDQTFQQ